MDRADTDTEDFHRGSRDQLARRGQTSDGTGYLERTQTTAKPKS